MYCIEGVLERVSSMKAASLIQKKNYLIQNQVNSIVTTSPNYPNLSPNHQTLHPQSLHFTETTLD